MPISHASLPSAEAVRPAAPHLVLAEEACPTCEQPIPHDHYEEIQARIEVRQREQAAEIAERLTEKHAREQAQALEQAHRESEAQIAAARDEARLAAEVAANDRIAAAELAGKEALTALQSKLGEANAARTNAENMIEKIREESAERELSIRSEATKAAETAMVEKFAESERRRKETEADLTQKIQAMEIGKVSAETANVALQNRLEEREQLHAAALANLQAEAAEREEEIRRQAEVTAQSAIQERISVLAEEKAAAEAKAALAENQAQTLQRAHETSLQEVREALEKAKDDAVNAEKSAAFEERLKLQTKFEELKRAYEKKSAEELGEGAEIDLYEALRTEFPHDRIERIQKGLPGADVLHTVVHNGKECGKIVYDSKNHGAWRNDFVTKLSSDQMAAKAEHAILSTSKFPAGGRQLQVQDGVILANPARVVAIVQIVRQHLIQSHTLRLSSEERTQKTAALYDFIISERCSGFFARIDTHTDDLLELQVKEKKAHETTWKRQGELVRSVQRVRAELANEIEGIVGATRTPECGG